MDKGGQGGHRDNNSAAHSCCGVLWSGLADRLLGAGFFLLRRRLLLYYGNDGIGFGELYMMAWGNR